MDVECVPFQVVSEASKRLLLVDSMATAYTVQACQVLDATIATQYAPVRVEWEDVHEEVAGIFLLARKYCMISKMRHHGFITSLDTLILAAMCMPDHLHGIMALATQDDVVSAMRRLIADGYDHDQLLTIPWSKDPAVMGMVAGALGCL